MTTGPMVRLGELTLDQDGWARVGRKAFDAVVALGADRDLAARVAGEVADVARWLERYAREGRVELGLERTAAGPRLAFAFGWSDLGAASDGGVAAPWAPPPTAGAGTHQLRFDLRMPDVARDALRRAGTIVDDALADPLADLRGLDLLDVDRGLRFVRGRTDLYRELLTRFLDDQRAAPAAIAAALAHDDSAGAERAAHTLRGLAACLGAGPLADAAGALEAALRSGAAARTVSDANDVLADEHRALFATLERR